MLAILCAVFATASFSFNDAMIKMLGSSMPLHQIVLIRSSLALAIILLVIVPLEGGMSTLRTQRPVLHVLRGFSVVIANIAFFSGLIVLPIANATAIFFVSPLLITAFSAVFLNELVYFRRWLALAIGLAGVWMIAQPGSDSFQWAYVLPLVAAIGYATLNTITRGMGIRESAGAMAFYVQIVFLVVSGLGSIVIGGGSFSGYSHPTAKLLLGGWVVPSMHETMLLLITGVCTAVAGYLISQAYRLGESGLVSPFEYAALVLSLVWGYLFWQELPGASSAVGILLILLSGLFVALAETGRRRSMLMRVRNMLR